MKKTLLLAVAALPVLLLSCATPKPRQAFHNADNSALIVETFNNRSCRVISPKASSQAENTLALEQAASLNRRQTAIVILEDYSEPQLGTQFRDRTFDWFIKLRGLGYQHIFFLQGNGVLDPDSLTTLAEYD